METTNAKPTARCLDLTRLLSRVGRGPMTGIDRVELAYLSEFVARDEPLFLLVRSGRRFFVFDNVGSAELLDRLTGTTPWGKSDWQNRLHLKRPERRRRAVSDLNRMSVASSAATGLAALLQRYLPGGATYFNVGHNNLSPTVISGIQAVHGSKIVVLIHDCLPLEHPEFQREGTPEKFEQMLRLVGKQADLVVFNSHASQKSGGYYFAKWGLVPKTIVAHLGVAPSTPDIRSLPEGIIPTKPYFITIGTIEPRKNHALLLDIWDRLESADNAPTLIIAGQRGWNNQQVFERLDQNPRNIAEFNDLSDVQIATLLAGSAGLLFPSFCEGFGYPPAEAARQAVPVVCRDLAVYHEVMGEFPIYLDSSDSYQWETVIRKLMDSWGNAHNDDTQKPVQLPSWKNHFNIVLELG